MVSQNLYAGFEILLELSKYFIMNVLYGCKRLEHLHLKSALLYNRIKKVSSKNAQYGNTSIHSSFLSSIRANVLFFFIILL